MTIDDKKHQKRQQRADAEDREYFASRKRDRKPPVPPTSNDPDLVILGLTSAASWSDILAAYRRLIFQHHPDRNSDLDATEKTKKIIAAFTRLKKKYVQHLAEHIAKQVMRGII